MEFESPLSCIVCGLDSSNEEPISICGHFCHFECFYKWNEANRIPIPQHLLEIYPYLVEYITNNDICPSCKSLINNHD